MDNNDVQLVGGPCGQHGPYTFYKAFKYTKNGTKRIVTLSEFFFVKLWMDSDLLCIGELQLLWSDKNSDQVLASLRLYFLPENTPEGRMDHGEDEVLAIAEKVVLRVEDLITWITVDHDWSWGRLVNCERDVRDPPQTEDHRNVIGSLTESSLDFSDVEKERKASDCHKDEPLVIILSYPRYCRYRAMMRRLEGVENEFLKYKIVNALGGFTSFSKNTRVLFCKDTFEYPELEGHELLCNHLAPKLKGRPRGKRKKRSVSPGSESNESESSVSIVFNSSKNKIGAGRNGIRCDSNLRRSTRATENTEGKDFLKELASFMKTNYTPIGRIPSLGYKELDLYSFYTKVQKLGGYDSVTANRLWKSIFDDMSGHQNSTSAATVIRRHYERFLLPYERYIKGEEYKPLPVSERRRLKSKTGSSASDAETSESTSRSGNSTPVPQTPVTPTTPTENKEFNMHVKSTDGKPLTSLRSVRVKSERQLKDIKQISGDNEIVNNNNINEDASPPPAIIKSETDGDDDEPDVKIEGAKIESVAPKTPEPSHPEKNAEPVTTAVAPVAQKLEPEKSHSPVEGKENIPIKTGDTPSSTNTGNNRTIAEVVEVPYKPNSPEVVDVVGADTYKIASAPYVIQEVKKRKLDILKEGGLEVTPVTFVSPGAPKDVRPSVIQQTIPNKIRDPNMPPPAINSLPPKRHHLVTSPHPAQSTNNKTPLNFTPPKVLQSRSIYSYSGKTVYGNPKDVMGGPTTTVHTPKFVAPPRQFGGEVLDLTVTSPQKPTMEVMKIPSFPMNSHIQALSTRESSRSPYNKPTPPQQPPPLLDGRKLGSNLEITLVGGSNNNNSKFHNQLSSHNPPPPKYLPPQQPPTYHHRQQHHPHHPQASTAPSATQQVRYTSQKRQYSENYPLPKAPRVDNTSSSSRYHHSSGRSHGVAASMPVMSTREGKSELSVPQPQPYGGGGRKVKDLVNSPIKVPAQMPLAPSSKQFLSPAHNMFPYLPQLYDSKNSLPMGLPMLDPIYWLPPGMSATPPPVLPFPPPDQFKYYAELMAQSSRLNFPYPVPPDGNPLVNNFKKP